MKAISNSKRHDAGSGVTYYSMFRTVCGRRFGIDVAITRAELEHGRELAAFRLRRARGELRRLGELMAGFDAADRRRGRVNR
ncbi:MAG: hypothetical protein ACXWVD_00145 [Telluria sp.]